MKRAEIELALAQGALLRVVLALYIAKPGSRIRQALAEDEA